MAADLVLKMFGAVTTTADSVMTIDIPQDGVLENLHMMLHATGQDALGDQFSFELSFGSTNTFSLNDARVSIAQISSRQNFLTSGGGVGFVSEYFAGLNIPMLGGERIHGHASVDSGVTGSILAYLYFSTSQRAPARRSSRRR